jgi:hypothetical protein
VSFGCVLEVFCYNRLVRRPVSYFWALHLHDTSRLSDAGADGLEYAQMLAKDAKLRSDHVLEHRPLLDPLTFNDVAESFGVSAATVRRRIAIARKQLFGNLSDSGIYYRLQRQRQLKARIPRPCKENQCPNTIPADASAGRKYCHEHRTPAARIRRHRRNHPRPPRRSERQRIETAS